MAQGPHIHNWKYGEPRETIVLGKGMLWSATRYCRRCRQLEEIPLDLKH